jgi:hypothetical protein
MIPTQQIPNQQFFPIGNGQKVSRVQRNTEGVIIGRPREPLIQQHLQDLSHQSSQQKIKILSLEKDKSLSRSEKSCSRKKGGI